MSTHKTYFRDFGLSVGEYGEILAALAFDGDKRGHVQAGYDVALPNGDRVEVKSKLAWTDGGKGKAQVINLSKSKLADGGMTHLLVIIVWPHGDAAARGRWPAETDSMSGGDILWAWLIDRGEAERLCAKTPRGDHIRVTDLRDEFGNAGGLIQRLQGVADQEVWPR